MEESNAGKLDEKAYYGGLEVCLVREKMEVSTCPAIWGYRRSLVLFSCQGILWLINARFCSQLCSNFFALRANDIPSTLIHPKLFTMDLRRGRGVSIQACLPQPR